MWWLKLPIDFICGALFAWGGYDFLAARRFIFPVVIGITISLTSTIWWLGLFSLPACGTLCIGYAGKPNWWRAAWVFIQAIALSSAVMFTHHLAWYIYIPYIVGAGILGGIYKNWQQIAGDFVVGFYLSLFLWGIHG